MNLFLVMDKTKNAHVTVFTSELTYAKPKTKMGMGPYPVNIQNAKE